MCGEHVCVCTSVCASVIGFEHFESTLRSAKNGGFFGLNPFDRKRVSLLAAEGRGAGKDSGICHINRTTPLYGDDIMNVRAQHTHGRAPYFIIYGVIVLPRSLIAYLMFKRFLQSCDSECLFKNINNH